MQNILDINGNFDEIFWVKVVNPQEKREPTPKDENDNEPLGLPNLVFAYQDTTEKDENAVSWDDVGIATSMDMDFKTVMIPDAEGSNLNQIFVNMDSTVLKNFRSNYKNPNEAQIEITNRKYYSSVYFHTLFLYTITKNRGYEIKQKKEGNDNFEDVDIAEYLKDLFDNYYSTFILNSGGMEEMMQSLSD